MKRLMLGFILALSVSFAYAQNAVVTQPKGVNKVDGSGSVAVTNTFQSVFAASTTTTGRLGCTIQNNGSNSMWVFFGPIANATKDTSVVLAAGQIVYCAAPSGVVLKDQVSITGTSTEKFYATQY